MRRTSLTLFHGASVGMLIAAFAACSGDDPPPPPQCGPNDVGCADQGEPCLFSINCQPGQICNKSTDELYVAEQPADTCVKVVCANDNECTAPKTCSLERICEAPVCQFNGDCQGGNVCLNGSCQPAPNAASVASCTVVTPNGAIKQGAQVRLSAVARNADGVALAGIGFVWTSNANTVTIGTNNEDQDVAIGGATSGPATITAKVDGKDLTCERTVTLNNFADLTPAQARVILVADDNGQPVDAAEVTIVVGGNATTQNTGADGSVTFDVAQGMTVDSITAIKDGYQWISVMSPPRDVFLPLPRKADITRAGGFRGSIDISTSRPGDVRLGLAGPSLPTNLLDFEFESLLGDFIPTTLDLTAIGQEAIDTDLPGGVVIGLQANNFTDDSGTSNVRCQGRAPTANELGCYVARAPAGPRAAWTLAGKLALTKVAAAAGSLASLFDDSGGDIDIGKILTTLLPFLRTLNHGIAAGLVITEAPKVEKATGNVGVCSNPDTPMYEDVCQGDFEAYQPIELAANQRLAIDSAVAVPQLPRVGTSSYAAGVVVLAVAITEGQGMVPLGLTAGLDVVEAATADGRVEGIEQPFGDRSDKLPDGQVPLTMAPPHSGVEGSRIALVGIALDPSAITGDNGVQFSGIVNYVERVEAQSSFGDASFMTFPKGTVDVAGARFTPDGAVAGASILRLELGRGDDTWLVYAPAGSAAITLPAVMRARQAILGGGMSALVQAVKSGASFANVFTFGSGTNLDRAIENIQAFVVQECVPNAPSANCKLQ